MINKVVKPSYFGINSLLAFILPPFNIRFIGKDDLVTENKADDTSKITSEMKYLNE